MPLRTLCFSLLAGALLLSCGGARSEGATCTFQPSDNTSDCADGLFCLHAGVCTGECAGSCVKACEVDADCADRTCSGRSSPETGQQKFCR